MQWLKAITVAAVMGVSSAASAQAPAAPAAPPSGMHPVLMGLTSTSFEDGGILPDRYTAKAVPPGGSPALAWTSAPAGTKSFTLVMHDSDVVVGKSTADNTHWVAFNIPATTTSLPEGVPKVPTLPDGTVQIKVQGPYGYRPPGAPAGVYHHYIFEIYALDTKLDLTAEATRVDVMKAMDGHVLDRGTLVGRFHR